MVPRALPNTKKDLQTITQDFVVFLSVWNSPLRTFAHFPRPTHFGSRKQQSISLISGYYQFYPILPSCPSFSDTFFMTKKYHKKSRKMQCFHRALPNTKKDLQTITQDFVVFLSCFEFTQTHPRAFSMANALWILFQVRYFGSKCGYIWSYLINKFTLEQLKHLFS